MPHIGRFPALESHLDRVMVFTQNVDGLHRQAREPGIIEIHGNLQALICTSCDHEEAAPDLSRTGNSPALPGMWRRIAAQSCAFWRIFAGGRTGLFNQAMQDGFDIVFSIGTSSVFPYISQPVCLPRGGIPTVEINPARTQLSDIVDYYLPLGAAEAMSAILARLGLGRKSWKALHHLVFEWFWQAYFRTSFRRLNGIGAVHQKCLTLGK
jgi:NAD-dependent deacetylase